MKTKKYLERALAKYRDVPHWEDAVQEGCIQFWRDSTESKYDLNHKQARAVMRAKSILFQLDKNKANYTGSIPKSSGAYVRKSGDKTRETIAEFVMSFKKQNGKPPSQAEICRGTGLNQHTVSDCLRRSKVQGVSVAARDVQLQAWDASNEDQSKADERSAISWESDIVHRLTVEPLMKNLPDLEKILLYGTFWLQMTSSELSAVVPLGKTAIQRRIKKTLNSMRSTVDKDDFLY